jgi:hypothetical protein
MRRRTPQEERARVLIANLSGKDGSRRVTARIELAEMPPDEAVGILLAALERDTTSRRRAPILISGVAGTTWFTIWLISHAIGRVPVVNTIQIFVQTLVIMSMASYRLRTNAYSVLTNYDDIRIIDSSIVAIRSGPAESRKPALAALIRLLPKLTPSDSLLVSHSSRDYLNEVLLTNVRTEFILAVLAAWEQIGDAEAVRFVERLSRGEGPAGHNNVVRQAAATALPTIRASATHTASSDTLLRPTESAQSPATLLRPTESTHDGEAASLLRPTVE